MRFAKRLRIFHNLASVFAVHLKEPEAMIFAGDSYKQVYAQSKTPHLSGRHGTRGFTDFSDIYKRIELPIHLLSCDETGGRQLAFMRQPDYNAKLARAAFGGNFSPSDTLFPEADGCVGEKRSLIIAKLEARAENKLGKFLSRYKGKIKACIPFGICVWYFYGMIINSIRLGIRSTFNTTGEEVGSIWVAGPLKNFVAVFTPTGLGITAVCVLLFCLITKKGYKVPGTNRLLPIEQRSLGTG